jgi:biopolymer transport protein ExbD
LKQKKKGSSMRLAVSDPEEIKINMTAMIDIVFQLLVFFIMTFKVVTMEGDFNIRMPLATTENVEDMESELPELIIVKLRAGENGNINSIVVDDIETFADETMFLDLTNHIESRIAGEGDPENSLQTELEFHIDYGLKCQYTVQAIEAVSGRVVPGPERSVKKLIEKIKFKDNTSQGG